MMKYAALLLATRLICCPSFRRKNNDSVKHDRLDGPAPGGAAAIAKALGIGGCLPVLGFISGQLNRNAKANRPVPMSTAEVVMFSSVSSQSIGFHHQPT